MYLGKFPYHKGHIIFTEPNCLTSVKMEVGFIPSKFCKCLAWSSGQGYTKYKKKAYSCPLSNMIVGFKVIPSLNSYILTLDTSNE